MGAMVNYLKLRNEFTLEVTKLAHKKAEIISSRLEQIDKQNLDVNSIAFKIAIDKIRCETAAITEEIEKANKEFMKHHKKFEWADYIVECNFGLKL